jgi:quinol monooxygenase YgiN
MDHVVITRVEVEEGSIDELAELFDRSNRELVSGHEDWLGAWFTANRETNEVTVLARWKDPTSYQRLRESDDFAAVMAQFAQRFVAPPVVSVNQLLVET